MGVAFEFFLVEWRLDPVYIVNNWTDELLNLMVEKLTERKERELNAMNGHKPEVSAEMLTAQSRGMVAMEKR